MGRITIILGNKYPLLRSNDSDSLFKFQTPSFKKTQSK